MNTNNIRAATWQNQQRDCTPSKDPQADLSLRWAHSHFVCFVMRRLICFYGELEKIIPKSQIPNLSEPRHEKNCLRVCDQVRLKPASCSATNTSQRLEILDIETGDIKLSRQWTTMVLIRLCWCTGWSAPLLFAYSKTGFLMTWLISFSAFLLHPGLL